MMMIYEAEADGLSELFPHLEPICAAVERGEVVLALLGQGAPEAAFTLPDGEAPVVGYIDDESRSEGPSGWHRASLEALARRCGVAIIATVLATGAYELAVNEARRLRCNVLIVETRGPAGERWRQFLTSLGLEPAFANRSKPIA